MKTLVIDNYDSFTQNLVHLIAQINQEEPLVVRNDAMGWDELAALRFDNIVISPGPGRPDRATDFGVCKEAIAQARIPVLGVCLGHQGIALAAGAALARAPELVHGRASQITHAGSPLFAGMPSSFAAARYHSFIVQRPLPPTLEEIAWSDDGLVMGVARRDWPQWGVQFHPESILTEDGRILLRNFRDMSLLLSNTARSFSFAPRAPAKRTPVPASKTRKAFWRELPRAVDAEAAFCSLYGDAPFTFWLDSSLIAPSLSRWSYLGDTSGPHGASLQYRALDKIIEIDDAHGRRTEQGEIFSYLQKQQPSRPQTPPPCPFVGGKIGWFGYELRNDCGLPASRRAKTPDALLIHADRFIAIDHLENKTYICAIDDVDESARAEQWLAATGARLDDLRVPSAVAVAEPAPRPLAFHLDVCEADYRANIQRCLDQIGQGESYQICLTNEVSCAATIDPLAVYRTLRNINPAPFAAFIKWPGGAVLSASPERFLSADTGGRVETKPIKGTIRRDSDPVIDHDLAQHLRTSQKDNAENAMIVDLLRHDLSGCCEPGSVVVPKLCDVETYQSVHQLVSTVRGVLKPGQNVVDLLRSAFPGGSMTGAPKHRTLEFIDQFEQRPRGIYSGALGWLGADGAADLSIVIRTIVASDGRFTIGVGGGIVAASTPQGEYDEMLLKAGASIKGIVTALYGSFSDEFYHLETGPCAAEADERQSLS